MDADMYFRKCHGSWLGKVIGSLYGMPVEGRDPREIKKQHGQFAGWQEAHGAGGGVINDDEQFEIVALLCLEEVGIDKLSIDGLARFWKEYLKRSFLFTAEKQVYVNWRKGIPPGEAALPENNPWFDFIGAQMKGEIFGQLVPGDLEETARLAAIDGAVAHHGIGVDGEIFVAEMVAQGIVSKTPPTRASLQENIETALSYCNEDGRYVKLGKLLLQWISEHPEPRGWIPVFERLEKWWREDCLEELIEENDVNPTHPSREQILVRCGIRPWGLCHVLPNFGIVLIALVYGGGDFGQSLQLAAMMGYDADCNVGNVGGILGAYWGDELIPDYWKKQINDEILIVIKDWEDPSISNLVRRIQAIARY
ncbi:MAG: ADP-ribosylglycohydrolase family protein [Candidatus Hodarchaeota archaeon]